ncbi:MAG: ATP-binding protein [candidate division KSB1 bacterium]|nr:ATP-binding protein [candidate division KSB1 bacterium]
MQQALKSANEAQALAQQRNRDLQQTMQALRENEEKFRSLVELSPDLIGIHQNGKIIFINPAGVRMLEAESAEQVIGMKMLDLLHPDSRDLAHKRIKQAMETGKPVFFEEEKLITLKGNLLDVEVASIPFTLNGETAIQMVARDISAHKEFEQKLQAARETAVENSNLKSQFLANISHELRTPLNGIIGMASLMHSNVKGTEQEEFLQEIKRSAEILQSLIDEILDFSHVETGTVKLEEHEFNLYELVKSIAHLYSFNAYNKNLEISCFISPEVPVHIVTDARKLRKILSILVENGIKFTQKGEIFIQVKTASKPDGPDNTGGNKILVFSIQDTGIGIPQDQWNTIFEPFRQLDGSHTRKADGMGLGLALCRQLVPLLGGEIWLDSRPGRGSTFYFSIAFKNGKTKPSVALSQISQSYLPKHYS